MLCTSCGANLGTRSSKFCPQCGVLLQAGNAPTATEPTAHIPDPDNEVTVLVSAVLKAAQTPVAPASNPDNESTVRMPAQKPVPGALQQSVLTTPPQPNVMTDTSIVSTMIFSNSGKTKLLQKPAFTPPQPDALTAASTVPTMIFSGSDKAKLLQKPVFTPPPQPDDMTAASTVPTMIFSGNDKAHLLQKPVFTPPPQPDALTAASTVPTMIFSGNDKAHLLQKPVFTPTPQPDALTAASTVPTMIFSGRDAGLVEPFISHPPTIDTVQNEPAPLFAGGAFPQPLLQKDDRIVADFPYPGSSPVTKQSIREGIHPAILGIAAAILIVFLGMLWWWNSEKPDYSPEAADAPLQTLPSDPVPDPIPDPVPDPTPASSPKLVPEWETEPGPELMGIPSLPMNQRQGRHNSTELKADVKDDPPPPSSTPTAEPAKIAPKPVEPVETDSARPPWLNQLRQELWDCQNFFCREKARDRYCTNQWKDLPECNGASL